MSVIDYREDGELKMLFAVCDTTKLIPCDPCEVCNYTGWEAIIHCDTVWVE